MQIFYGTYSRFVDVTNLCLLHLTINNIITIPMGDNNRAAIFTDIVPGVLKKIIILNNNNMTVYDDNVIIKIDTTNNIITTTLQSDLDDKLNSIHSKISILYGSMNDELPEQKMAIRYLTGNEKVLELGGNIGRNSLVIASILQDDTNLVTLECDANVAMQLKENRELNHFKFHIEESALSKKSLIQHGLNTIPSDTLIDGYTRVNTITFDELQTKYNIVFDTLVLDCEGAFYYILMDMPEILNNIKLIIMENDYWDISHKIYVDETLRKYNFDIRYKQCGGWGPCVDNFFEVWQKIAL